ncbi:hypothetical protein [Kitasatospora sp. NBC_01300]|uniref:hypothetical protein n=1 Tax=Kitasatospora sp. NBC_01300 TaxID=2903574 RepID=UPI002F917271|nr:hypothetical protein OG556_40970 [Kitasatospora sp. NBC_01300]
MEQAEEVAGELFTALLNETGQWADDDEQGWVERLREMPPAVALTAMEESNCLPGQLAGPAAAALRFLAPHVYGTTG